MMNEQEASSQSELGVFERIDNDNHLLSFALSDDSSVSYAAVSKLCEMLDEVLSTDCPGRAHAAEELNDLLRAHMDNVKVSGYFTALG